MNDKGQPTTLAEIEALPMEILRPADVAAYLKVGQQNINVSARDGLLPWAYKINSRTMIPKEAFINYHRYGQVVVRADKDAID